MICGVSREGLSSLLNMLKDSKKNVNIMKTSGIYKNKGSNRISIVGEKKKYLSPKNSLDGTEDQ